jgi:serine O-acetyltransferase
MDAYNGASLGTHIGYGAKFGSVPQLPHGIRGIFISHNAVIGKNCRIFHQVTIGKGKGGAPEIGDNVMIGAGAKVIGKIKVGDNVKIGANCVVVDNIPDNSTVVMQKTRIISEKG